LYHPALELTIPQTARKPRHNKDGMRRDERTEAKALDSTQAEWLLSAAQGRWLHPIIALAMATGCRRGKPASSRAVDESKRKG
jgi:integrase